MLSCMAWPSPLSTSMKPCKHHALCCLALLLSVFSNWACADITGDASALLVFKATVTNAAGGNLQSWNASTITNICTSWKGVKCSNESAPRVIELRLPGLSLFGPIPPQTLGNLDALQVLSLRKNKLSGSLPLDLANCAALRQIILNNNNFSGSLPVNFSAWPLLKKLDFSSNNFSGQIPSSLSSLTHLDSLFLENNELSGSIPPTLGASSLSSFSVADNNLTGSIPAALARFPADRFAGNSDLCGAPLDACTSTQAPAPTPASAPAPTSSNLSNGTNDDDDDDNKLKAGVIAGIAVASAAALIVLLCAFFLLCVRRKKKQGHAEDLYVDGRTEFESKTKGGAISNTREAAINRKASGRSGDNGGAINNNNNNKLIFMGNAKQTFDLDDLLRASAEVLGKGSIGTSYKALMDEGKPLCVKRFREVATEHDETCKHFEMLGTLQHPNLVPLRAYFLAPKGKLLVSDYMPKGNLSSLLHGKKGVVKEPLSWEARLTIAGGAAKGVVFLHSKKIVHGNIKANNVVMDLEGQAHLTDYSLVQLMPREPGSNLQPSAYTSPEARGELRKVTYKGDVYAFGVLLLELVTGSSPSNNSNFDELVQWVQGHVPQNVESVLDPLLVANADDNLQDDMISLLNIALPCVSTAPEKRPHMVEVVSSIENLRKRNTGPETTDFYFTQAA